MKTIWNGIKSFFSWIKAKIKAFVAAIKAKFSKPVVAEQPLADDPVTETPAEPEAVKVSWINRFGRGVARVLAAIGSTLTAVARVLFKVVTTILTVALILVMAVAIFAVFLGLVAYKGFQALFMLISTPHYIDEGTAEHNWEMYGKSWNWRFFGTLTLADTERAVMDYEASKQTASAEEENTLYFGMFDDAAFSEAV